MAKETRKAASAAERVTNISPAAMKVILAKIGATTNPGTTHGSESFVKGPTDFSQTGDFYKFSRPGESTPVISVQSEGGFKINAEVVKGIEGK